VAGYTVGDEPLAIMDQALADDGYAYTNKVGEEDKIVIRQRIGINSMKCPRRRILRDLSRKKRVGRRREHETRQQRWPRGEISLSSPPFAQPCRIELMTDILDFNGGSNETDRCNRT
jgi:hypothetical protein